MPLVSLLVVPVRFLLLFIQLLLVFNSPLDDLCHSAVCIIYQAIIFFFVLIFLWTHLLYYALSQSFFVYTAPGHLESFHFVEHRILSKYVHL